MDKRLIEDGSVELVELFDEVSREARIEKPAVPPINKMLYWWTRKPLIVVRAVAITSTLNDTHIDDRLTTVKKLLNINEKERA